MKEPITTFGAQDELNACLAYWQEKLFLQHWLVIAVMVDAGEIDGNSGRTVAQWGGSTALIRLNREYHEHGKPHTKCPVELTLVHELLHLRLGKESENEALVEQMAKSFLMVKYQIPLTWFRKDM